MGVLPFLVPLGIRLNVTGEVGALCTPGRTVRRSAVGGSKDGCRITSSHG
ncbi:hypothetical protein SGL43_02814 [Streptomyces globisporus]|uniref:Uncharacterized protein n=1 Tax=Streptomyces globisporus TaxID=1908 RepID=A0ABN8UZU6_STRGL|nr:hypothetical protein SGL43_02814 [Streptomyces globisporus]